MSGLHPDPEPLVSVVIPVRNRPIFLHEAVHSVLEQSYSRIECIVVDDGSEITPALPEFSSDRRLRLVRCRPRGVSHARNRGIAESSGRYIGFLDSDDLWEREKLERQIAALGDAPHAGLCYTNEKWYMNGRWTNQKKRHVKYDGWIFPFCLPLCIISFSSAIFPVEVLRKIGDLNERLPVCEDYEYWIRLSLRYPVRYLPERLIVKRGGHAGQLSFRYWGIDRFRIQSLLGILASEEMTPLQRDLLIRELARKCRVVSGGARKRGYNERAEYYERISNWASTQTDMA